MTLAPADVRRAPARGHADEVMHSLLRLPEVSPRRADRGAHRVFSVSIVISALRCLLTYVALPLVAPIFSAATGAGPVLGVPIGLIALVFDVVGIRRFWLANHPQRWPITWLYVAIMAMVTTFLVIDCVHLAR
jgi:hypothetical protein